jgi:hypothetical protein
VKWEDVQGKTKAEFVSADGKKISGVASWGSQNEPVLFCNKLKDNVVRPGDMWGSAISDNIQKVGYMMTTAPNGEEILIIRENVRQKNGKTGTVDIAFRGGIIKDPEYIRGWFGKISSIFFMPAAFSGPWTEPSWIDQFIFENRTKNDVALLQEFCRTGNMPVGMSDGWWVGAPQRGN